jgi:hypothetical protein
MRSATCALSCSHLQHRNGLLINGWEGMVETESAKWLRKEWSVAESELRAPQPVNRHAVRYLSSTTGWSCRCSNQCKESSDIYLHALLNLLRATLTGVQIRD